MTDFGKDFFGKLSKRVARTFLFVWEHEKINLL